MTKTLIDVANSFIMGVKGTQTTSFRRRTVRLYALVKIYLLVYLMLFWNWFRKEWEETKFVIYLRSGEPFLQFIQIHAKKVNPCLMKTENQ